MEKILGMPMKRVFFGVGLFAVLISCKEFNLPLVGRFLTDDVLLQQIRLIQITRLPDKMLYPIDEPLDPSGIVVTAFYKDEEVKDITDRVQYEGFDSRSSGLVKVRVVFGQHTAEFAVTVVPDSGTGTPAGSENVMRDIDGGPRFFETLQEAFYPVPTPTVSAGPVITIINDIDIDEPVIVNSGNFELAVPAGSQKTIKRAAGFSDDGTAGGGSFFKITGGSLKIAASGTDQLVLDGDNVPCNWAAVHVSGGAFTMGQGAIIKNNKNTSGNSGGAVSVSGGAFTMEGGIITGNTAANGSAVSNEGGELEIGGSAWISGVCYLAVGRSIRLKTNLTYHNADNPVFVTVADLPTAGGTRLDVIRTDVSPILMANNIAKFTVPPDDSKGYFKLAQSVNNADITLPNTVYVKAGGGGLNDGSTPANAYDILQAAITAADTAGHRSVTVIDELTATNSNASSESVFDMASKGTFADPITITGVDGATLNAALSNRVMHLDNSHIVLENIVITNGSPPNSAFYGAGGGILLANASTLKLKSGAKITGNLITKVVLAQQTYGGGGVYVPAGCTLTMYNGAEISGNECAHNQTDAITRKAGGGVQISGGTFNMAGGIICGNKADLGGGVDIQSGTFNMTGGTIGGAGGGNLATKEGGGIHINNGTFNMSNGEITYNTAGNKTISTNLSWMNGGGGIGQYQGSFNMTGGTIANNTAGNKGTFLNGGDQYYRQGAGNGTLSIPGITTPASGTNFHIDIPIILP